MAYSVLTDIESEFKDVTFSSTTAVTDDDIDGFIDQADAFIDSSISSRYEVPVTGSSSLLVLKTISILLVKARVLSILSVKTPQDKTKQDPDGPTLRQQALDMLKAIKNGSLLLTDAVLTSTDGGLTSFLINEDITYTYPVDQDVW